MPDAAAVFVGSRDRAQVVDAVWVGVGGAGNIEFGDRASGDADEAVRTVEIVPGSRNVAVGVDALGIGVD